MGRNLLRLCALHCALNQGTGQAEEAANLLAMDHRLYGVGFRDDACAEAIS